MDSLIGRFVTSKAGHDKGMVYVVLAVEGDYVQLCDGKSRPVSRPKKKRLKHVQIINQKAEDTLLMKLQRQEIVTDEQIKLAVKLYQQRYQK